MGSQVVFILLSLFLNHSHTVAVSGYGEQEPIYDGRDNIPGQIFNFKDEPLLDQAISQGCLLVGQS
jgi:hypothetical protein